MKTATCVYLIRESDNTVLLAKQVAKIIGRKGYGGKIEAQQTIRSNAVDETAQESGVIKELRVYPEQDGGVLIKEEDLIPIGLVDFYNGADVPFGDPNFRVYFFLCKKFSGVPIDTTEMIDPQWYLIDQLPIEELVPGDEYFVPTMLKGIAVSGYIRRTEDWTSILEHTVKECSPNSLDF